MVASQHDRYLAPTPRGTSPPFLRLVLRAANVAARSVPRLPDGRCRRAGPPHAAPGAAWRRTAVECPVLGAVPALRELAAPNGQVRRVTPAEPRRPRLLVVALNAALGLELADFAEAREFMLSEEGTQMLEEWLAARHGDDSGEEQVTTKTEGNTGP
jgi:hypothetical protein